MRYLIGIIIACFLAASAWAAEPTAPTAPTAVDYNVASAALSTDAVTSGDAANLKSKVEAITTCGVRLRLPVATYNLASQITLPAVAGTCVGTGAGRSATTGSTGASAIAGAGGLSATTATGGDDYIIIESANYASLPAAGTTINLDTDLVNMPTIVLPSVNSTGAFLTSDNAHHIILRGLHIKTQSTTCTSCGLLLLQSPTATDPTKWPSNVYVERSYLEGASGGGTVRGTHMTGYDMGIVDSVVTNIATNGAATDQQAVLVPGGGPMLIRNNVLSAGSETIMLGDNKAINFDPALVAMDVTIQGNYLYKPLSWIPFSAVFPLNATDFASTTAAIDASPGTCVTLTGKVPDASWADGTKYFITTADKNGSGYYSITKLITAVGVCNGANSITIASAHTRAGQSGLSYHISYYTGVKTGDQVKNHIECKNCKRVLMTGNVMRNVSSGNQFTAIVMSSRGGNGLIQDIDIQNNYIKDTVSALNITQRPTIAQSNAQIAIAGDGTTNCSGSPCVQITYLGGIQCDCVTGGTAHILSINDVATGVDEAKGLWALTKISQTVITIPAAYLGGAYLNNAIVAIYHQGSPTSRVRVKNNVIEEPGSWQMASSDAAITRKYTFTTSPFPVLPAMSDGHSDDALSTTGNWKATDINFEHNTVIAPAGANSIAGLWTATEGGSTGYVYSGDLAMPNFSWRSNVFMYSGEGVAASNYGLTGTLNSLAGSSIQLQGPNGLLARVSDGSENWSNNVFYKTGAFTATQEYAKQTGSYIYNAVVADNAKVGFTSYTTGTPATLSNFALTHLFTTGTCTTSTASLTVTCSNTLPATIVKGTPFKINSDGRFCLVNTASGTTITLQASVGSCTASGYPSTNTTAAFTLGFKGWGHDAADPGADMTAVMNAISGVVKTPTGVIVDP